MQFCRISFCANEISYSDLRPLLPMSLIVMKFGGTSVGTIDRIKNAASKVAAEIKRGNKVAVVVSAMSGVTDQLLDYCKAISPHYDQRESDAIVATGEQVTSGLMALALHQYGLNARSWQGWQVKLKTDAMHGKARILDIETDAILQSIHAGETAVMAGFQGISENGRITTLGRGGSDTSAVALAIALKADRCDIYTDVEGVYTTDPRIVTTVQKRDRISYEEMLELAGLGAKVLQVRSVAMGMRYSMPIQVISTFINEIGSDLPGTLITQEDKDMENNLVTGIAYTRDEAQISLVQVADKPGVAACVFDPLGRAGVNVDMIVQSVSENGHATGITFTVGKEDFDRALKILEEEKASIGFAGLITTRNRAKLSIVGIGMRRHAGVAATMFQTLAKDNINIEAIQTSEITLSVLIDEKYLELALRSLHSAFDLDIIKRTAYDLDADVKARPRPEA